MLDRATALVAQLAAKEAHIGVIAGKCDLLAERLVAVRDLIRSAHGTLLLGSAPQAREHLQQAAKDLTDLVEGRV